MSMHAGRQRALSTKARRRGVQQEFASEAYKNRSLCRAMWFPAALGSGGHLDAHGAYIALARWQSSLGLAEGCSRFLDLASLQ